MASGVNRRFVEETTPSRIRIQKFLEELEMKPLLEHKKQGNEMFGKKQYQDAIDLYDKALMIIPEMYVGPYDQAEQIVAILSNKAECELRLELYHDAGRDGNRCVDL